MTVPQQWQGIPYHPISMFYKQRFGCRVQKIPVSVAEDCPNRRGLKGMQTCSFCDVWGSAAYPENREHSLREQIEENRIKVSRTVLSPKFLVYFQAYTNTFARLQRLRENFDIALSYPEVCGIVVGTRPDCISKGVLQLWTEFHRRSFVAVELGVQSFSNDQLLFLRRGHSAEQSLEAIFRINKEAEVDLGIHLIFGIPGETDEHIIKTARLVSTLPISNVKLHNLHVLKSTELERLYLAGEFTPIDEKTYSHRVGLFLQYLNPRIAVHRLVAVAARWDECVAPDWTKYRRRSHQYVMDYLKQNNIYQGQFWDGNSVLTSAPAADGRNFSPTPDP